MAQRKVVVGDRVKFTDEDGRGDNNARNGDIGVVLQIVTNSSRHADDLLWIKLSNRDEELSVCAYRVEVLEDETTLDEAVKQCKNLKTEIQRLQLELNKYENILFKAGVKLI